MKTMSWMVVGAMLTAGTAQAQTGSLVSTLVSQLGVTDKQASGGAGSILSYAKSNLSADDFGKITKAVPETEGLVKAAPASSTDALGGNLGGTLGSIAGAASLTDSFQKLGLSGDMVLKFAPVVVNYVSGKGGSSVGGVLSGALGGILGGGGSAPAAAAAPAAAPAAPTAAPVTKKTTTKKK